MIIKCPECSVKLKVPVDKRGRKIRCPKCRTALPVLIGEAIQHNPTSFSTKKLAHPGKSIKPRKSRKSTKLAYCRTCSQEVSKFTSKCPNCEQSYPGLTTLQNIIAILAASVMALFLVVVFFVEIISQSSTSKLVDEMRKESKFVLPDSPKNNNEPLLEYTSRGWRQEYGWATYEGQVKNISDIQMKNVQAVVTWYDKNGDIITSNSALIEYNPILPGQTSPFKVMKTYNPAMHKAGIEFSYFMGGMINSREK